MIEIHKITEVLQHLHGLSAVVFDLDDTLYSEKEYVRSGFREVAKLLSQVPDARKKLWDAFEEKKPAIDTVLANAGIDSDDLKNKCLNAYRAQTPDIHLYDGVPEMLRAIRAQGTRLGIITDGRLEGQRAKIAALGLAPMVDAIIVTDELGGICYRKPCPQAFERMKNQLGSSYPSMCYVGDNITKDFQAPEALGMRCIWFQNADGLYTKP